VSSEEARRQSYRLADSSAILPVGMHFGDVGDVGVDSLGRVYVFNRNAENPVVILDATGRFLDSWGQDVFDRPHGLSVGPDDTLYLTDDGDHTVRRCSPDGTVLLEIGNPRRPSDVMSGDPFNRCTHTALSPDGDIYVSDGYGNARVHKYSPGGTHLSSWGRSGAREGEFNIPHNLVCDRDGFVYVADRENHRIQVFDERGHYVKQWNNLHRPCGLALIEGDQPLFLVTELPPGLPINLRSPNLGPRITVLDASGSRVATLGSGIAGTGPMDFIAPHGIAVDPQGAVYVGDVAHVTWPYIFPDAEIPSDLQTFKKLVPTSGRGILDSAQPREDSESGLAR
jgi:DNA-binding beta-propeller fold protein YncE